MKISWMMLSFALTISMVSGQIVIDDAAAPVLKKAEAKPPPDPKQIPKLVESLKDDKAWWEASKELARFGETEHEVAVFEALGELWRSTENPAIQERFYVVSARLAQPSSLRARRARTEELIGEVKHFLDKVEKVLATAMSPEQVAEAARYAKTVAMKLEKLRAELKELDEEALRRATSTTDERFLRAPPDPEEPREMQGRRSDGS